MTWTTKQTLVANADILATETSTYSAPLNNANEAALELVVSTAPRAATPVRVYAQYSIDGTNWSEAQTVGQFVDVTETGRYFLHTKINAPYARFAISPMNYGLSAALNGAGR